MEGGIESALNQTGNIKVEPKLYMVKGKRNVRIVQVSLKKVLNDKWEKANLITNLGSYSF